MGIEGGSIGSVSVGPSIGPSIRGISSGIVNEGPVRGSLEGFRPMSASDISTIDKGGTVATSGLSVIEQAKAVAAKAWKASESLVPAEVVSQAEVIISQAQQKSLSSSHPEPGIWHLPSVTWTLPDYQPVPFTESRVSNQAAPAISPQPLLQEQEVEEVVTEKVTEEETAMVEEEGIEKIKRKYVVDDDVLDQRIIEIKAAVLRAKEEAGKLGAKIAGKLIAWFLPAEHPGNRSEVVKKKGPDGSLKETQEAIEGLKEFAEKFEAEIEAIRIVKDRPPIKIRAEGEPVSPEDVERVYRQHFPKPKLVEELGD